jgi:hypothetical protein
MSPRERSVPPGADLAVAGRGRTLARRLTEQWRAPRGLGPPLWRQVLVTGRDSTAQTFTVDLGGDDPELPMPVSGCRALPPYVGRLGDVAWALQNGSDFLLLGATANVNGLPVGLPGAKLRAVGTQTGTAVSAPFLFDAAGDLVEYDTERDENGLGIADLANSQLVCRWPGPYHIGFHCAYGAAASGRRFCAPFLNGTQIPPRLDLTSAGGDSFSMSSVRQLTVGDTLVLRILGNGAVFGDTGEIGMALWMHLVP